MSKTNPTWDKTPRTGEVIGGGFIVMRRHESGRVKAAMYPFEYDNMADAEAQAVKLAHMHRGMAFEIFRGVGVQLSGVNEEAVAA